MSRFITILTALAVAVLGYSSAALGKTDSRAAVQRALQKSKVRGAIVFRTYCTACHGHTGAGNKERFKLYGKDKLLIKQNNTDYYEDIIRLGGEALGKSPYMPMWQDELSEEQIADVVEYLTVLPDQVQRGRAVFRRNCILCHGVNANGKGRASVLYDPPPSDLTRSDKNDDYKKLIITYGGAAMGRSSVMPVWGEQLSPEEIDDVVRFLRTVLVEDD